MTLNLTATELKELYNNIEYVWVIVTNEAPHGYPLYCSYFFKTHAEASEYMKQEQDGGVIGLMSKRLALERKLE